MRFPKTLGFFVATALASSASAAELVKNGSLEAFTAPYTATSWTIPDLGTNPDGDPNNYARVGSWANQVGTDPYGFLGGPHGAGNGTGSQIPTRTAWLGGLNPRTSIIQQNIDTAGFVGGSATLAFKLVYEDEDVPGADFFIVDFGGTRVKTVDMGAGYTTGRGGGIHWWVLENVVLDLSPYLDGTVKTLTFTTINDAKPSTSSSAWIDNISIQAQPVPEPGAFATLGLGTLVCLRRRSKRPA